MLWLFKLLLKLFSMFWGFKRLHGTTLESRPFILLTGTYLYLVYVALSSHHCGFCQIKALKNWSKYNIKKKQKRVIVLFCFFFFTFYDFFNVQKVLVISYSANILSFYSEQICRKTVFCSQKPPTVWIWYRETQIANRASP